VELRIYDADHKQVRHVSSEAEREAKRAPLPVAQRWFPAPQRLEASAGMHRFLWNLAWGTSGVAESDEPDDGEGDVPRGPRVAPGKYTLKLEVDGKKAAPETLVVVMDPRSPASQTELEQQFDISYRIFADSLESRRALAEIGSVQAQLSKMTSEASARNGEIDKRAQDLAATIDAVLEGSSQLPEKFMGLNQANTELTAALHVAESSDRTTPSQALAVYAEAHKASSARVAEWTKIKQGPLGDLNQRLKAQRRAPIAIAEIEREVYYLMTR
jgi:hypothetical protein